MARRARSVCMPELALKNPVPARTQHYAESVGSRLRILKIATVIGAFISAAFAIFQLSLGGRLWWLGLLNIAVRSGLSGNSAAVPVRRADRPVDVLLFAYLFVGFICYTIGTGSGLQFYFLVSASLVVLVLGIERIVLASTIVALGVA